VPFSCVWLDSTLLLATDGLFNFARPETFAARELIRLVRLPSGGLQDDVGLVLVRAAGT
jgi:hypothetical protein